MEGFFDEEDVFEELEEVGLTEDEDEDLEEELGTV